MKLDDAINKYVMLNESNTWSNETKRYYDAKLPSISKYLGEYNVEEIDKYVIAEFTKNLKIRNLKITNTTLNYYR